MTSEVNDRWRVLLACFQLSSDFQQLELFKLTKARLGESGVSFPQMKNAMAWHVDAIKNFAEGRPPPQMQSAIEKIMSTPHGQSAESSKKGNNLGCLRIFRNKQQPRL